VYLRHSTSCAPPRRDAAAVSALVAALCGLLGLLVGALLPVVIERVPAREPLARAPFPEIRTSLRAAKGVVLVLGTGALWAAIGFRFDESAALPAFLLFGAALVTLSVIDLRHFLLPNRIVYPVTAASFVLLAVAAVVDSDAEALGRAVACAVGAFAVFFVLHVVSPRAMGFGDVRLAFLLGLDLGWLGVGEVVLGLLLGFVYGAAVGLVLLATGARSRRDHIPFGPFLAAGALTALLVGETILDWYSG
jgi:leader peptidase (prepilin peptidase) / N-methyltransferase